MKLILKNSELVFAKNIQDEEHVIGSTILSGKHYYWSPVIRTGSSVDWTPGSLSNRNASPVYEIDRTKYNVFEIVVPDDITTADYINFAYSGKPNGAQILNQGVIYPNTEYDLRDVEGNTDTYIIPGHGNHTLDGFINSESSVEDDDKVLKIAFWLKNVYSEDGQGRPLPYATDSEFERIKIVFKQQKTQSSNS